MRYTLILIALAGCTPYTTGDKIAFGAMTLAAWADYETTNRYIGIGGTEANPFLDDRPSRDDVALFKLSGLAVGVLLGEIWPDSREEIFWTLAAVSGGAAAWNDRLYERYK